MPMTQKLWTFEIIQARKKCQNCPYADKKDIHEKTGDSRLQGK